MANPNKFTAKEVLNKVLLDSSGNAVTANSVTSQEALNSVLDTTNNRLNMSLAGGTISGDVTIEGDLTVNGNGTGNYDEIVNGNLVISSGNKLGVGTETPDFTLHVHGASDGDGYVKISDGTTGEGATDGARIGFNSGVMRIQNFENSDMEFYVNNSTKPLVLESDGTSTFAGDVTISKNANTFLNITATGGGARMKLTGQADEFTNGILFYENADLRGQINYNHADQKMEFKTGDSNTLALTIDSSQRLGIGETIPDKKLHIKSSTSTDGIKIEQSGTGASIVTFFADGSERAFIGVDDSDGNAFLSSTNGLDYVMVMRSAQEIHFGTNGNNTAMVIDNSQNVGIGATIPDGTLHVHTATAGTVTADVWVDDLVVENSGDGGISILTPSANQGAIAFGDPDDANRAQITYQHNTDTMLINSGGSTALTIDSSQRVGIGTTSPSSYNDLANNLVVYKNSNSGITIGSSTTGTGSIFFADGTTGDEAYKGRIEYNHGQNKLQFGANSVIHTTLDASGNVGIGTSIPTSPASVGRFLHIADAGSAGIVLEDTNAGDWEMYNAGGVLYFEDRGNSALALALDVNSRISLSNNDSGTSNTLFGYEAGNAIANSGSTGNVLIGHRAGRIANNSAFDNNVAIGFEAMQGVGGRNLQNVVAIGSGAFRQCDSGAPDGTVAIGSSSLYSLTTGEKNVAIGFESMLYQTDGANNTVLGYNALRNADNGESDNVVIGKEAGININHASADANVIIGSNAGLGGNGPISGAVVIGANAMNSTGANNITGAVAVGYNSLTALTSGINNTAIGYTSLESVTTGSGNTALGMGSGDSITDGHDNVIIGVGAGNATTTVGNATIVGRKACQGVMTASSDGAVAVGYEALKSLTSGAGSVGIGYRAGDAITSGDFNTAIGYGALALETTGDRNTAVGYNSLQSANGTNNASNTAVGFESGNLISSGFHNVTIGAKAGNVITTGDYNVIIGGESDPSGNNGQNQIVVGYGATGVADNSVTLGNADVTDVYMAQDSGATVHSSALEMSSFKITQKTFVFASGSTHDIGTADANFCGKIKMYTNHNSGAGYIEYSLVYSTNAKALSLINQNQPYFASVVTLTLNSSTGTVSTSSLSYGQGVTVVVESLNEANASFTFA